MKDYKVYITGAGGGLGLEIFNFLKNKGIEVNCHSHNKSFNFDKKIVYGNITEMETLDNVYNHFIETESNILINNIGIYSSLPFCEMSSDEIKKIIETNLTSTIILTNKILKHIINNNGGMIYFINSIAGLKASINESVYCATKFGIKGFSDSIIMENKENKNIRITNVTLGAFKSKITKNRKNYDELMDPKEIAEELYFHIIKKHKTINTELNIFRK